MPMKKLIQSLVLFFLFSLQVRAEIAVIGNLNSPVISLSKQEVQDIFMGRTRSLPNGNFALPLDFQELRTDFYTKLTARPIEQINAYWARIMFSGQASPPVTLPDEMAVLKTVSENKSAIAYVDSKRVNPKLVRVLLILE